MYVALSEKQLLGEAPSDFREFLAAMYEANAERNRELLRETANVVTLLRDGGVDPPVVLKGIAYLITGVIGRAGARYIGDVDLLLPPTQAEEAVRILVRSGMRPVKAAASPFDCANHYHYPRLSTPNGRTAVEIHRALPAWYSILSAEEVLRESQPAAVEGAAIRIPGPDHLVLHHILHAFSGARSRMRPSLAAVYDMALIAQRFGGEVHWTEVGRRFRDAGLQSVLETWVDVTEWFCGVRLPFEYSSTIMRKLRSRRVIGLCSSRWLRRADPGYIAVFLAPYLTNAGKLALSAEGRHALIRKICDGAFYSRMLITYRNHGT